MLLEEGLKALQQQNYAEAVQILEEYCQQSSNFHSPLYIQAKMALARAYRGNNQRENAISLAQELEHHLDAQVSSWAKGLLSILAAEEKVTGGLMAAADIPRTYQKAGRAAQMGVQLAISGVSGNLKLASTVTILLLLGMVLVVCFALMLIVYSQHPLQGLIISLVLTLIFNGTVFFISPWLMDMTQQWLYKTRWVTLAEIKRNSPEAATIIQRVCREKRLNPPKLGIIDDRNPTAFTYGSLPGNARLVVSQGLFTYLDEEEVATVYAHELGHIVHWDFALMTVAACLVQITYLLYIFARRIGRDGSDDSKAAGVVSAIAYIFYIVGTYLTLYLSRTREYFADHFAAEATGNPNGLSRALVKIAYGLLEEEQNSSESSRLLEGTRALGIYDPKAAASTGTAYRITTEPRKIGQVFLWDLFNPWGWWMELASTHPLTGKRIRALSTYAEQMGLDTEFNLAEVVLSAKKLDKSKLYGTFFLDVCLFYAEAIASLIGLVLGGLWMMKSGNILELVSLVLIGFGIGSLLKTFFMYPSLHQVTPTDVFSLMCDPYASPLRGRPVQLQGELIGRGEAGYQFSSNLMLQDRTGMIFTRYASRLGAAGNFLFGWTQVRKLIGEDVRMTGWFRRGVAPWLDWRQITHQTTTLNSHPRFWSNAIGAVTIVIGIGLVIVSKG